MLLPCTGPLVSSRFLFLGQSDDTASGIRSQDCVGVHFATLSVSSTDCQTIPRKLTWIHLAREALALAERRLGVSTLVLEQASHPDPSALPGLDV